MSSPAFGTLVSPRAWVRQAACRDEDPELFFPLTPGGPALHEVARAKAVCARCEVRGECLRYALETGQSSGVWGGTTEMERRAFRQGRVLLLPGIVVTR